MQTASCSRSHRFEYSRSMPSAEPSRANAGWGAVTIDVDTVTDEPTSEIAARVVYDVTHEPPATIEYE